MPLWPWGRAALLAWRESHGSRGAPAAVHHCQAHARASMGSACGCRAGVRCTCASAINIGEAAARAMARRMRSVPQPQKSSACRRGWWELARAAANARGALGMLARWPPQYEKSHQPAFAVRVRVEYT